MTPDDELAYWKTLAVERGLALEALYARLAEAFALATDEQIGLIATAWNGDLAGWTREPDRMEPLAELRKTDILSALDDLWNRVAVDGGR